MIKLLSMFTFILIVSCAVSKTKLSDDGKEVRILPTKNNSECQVLDKIVADNEKGSDELARNHARNLAASKGGNAITIDQVVSNGNAVKMYATVFDCD